MSRKTHKFHLVGVTVYGTKTNNFFHDYSFPLFFQIFCYFLVFFFSFFKTFLLQMHNFNLFSLCFQVFIKVKEKRRKNKVTKLLIICWNKWIQARFSWMLPFNDSILPFLRIFSLRHLLYFFFIAVIESC